MNTELKQDNRLLKKEYYKALFPVMFSVLGATINALIDSVFVSQKLGPDGLAAVNLSMPVYLVICMIASLIAGGASVCSARKAGQDNMKEAQNYFRDSIQYCVGMSVLFTVLGIVFCGPVSELLSGGSGLSGSVYSYCIITFIGSSPAMLVYITTYYLQLDGKNKAISVSVIIMVASDILFDILLIYVFEFGLYGASAASVLSTVFAVIYGFAALFGGKLNYRPGLIRPDTERLKNIIRYGSPWALINLFDAVKLFLINIIILGAAGESGAAVWAVLNTLSEVSLPIVSGVPRTAAPMVGTFYTSHENGGIRMLTAIQIRVGMGLSLLYAVIVIITHPVIAAFFNISRSMLIPCICLGVYVIFSTLCSVWERYFTSIGFISAANITTGARNLILPVAAALMLAGTGDGLWMFMPVSAAATVAVIAVITFIRYLRSRNTKRPLSPVLLLDDSLEKANKVLDFSIDAKMEDVCSAAEKIKDFCSENNMNMKIAIRLGLAMEELLNVIIVRSPGVQFIDLRTFVIAGSTGVRIRYGGPVFDPFHDEQADDDMLMGINILNKLADTTTHIYTLGFNVLTIIFPLHDTK